MKNWENYFVKENYFENASENKNKKYIVVYSYIIDDSFGTIANKLFYFDNLMEILDFVLKELSISIEDDDFFDLLPKEIDNINSSEYFKYVGVFENGGENAVYEIDETLNFYEILGNIFDTYNFQKKYFDEVIENDPKKLAGFTKMFSNIDPKIKEEYADIFDAEDLGLFYKEK